MQQPLIENIDFTGFWLLFTSSTVLFIVTLMEWIIFDKYLKQVLKNNVIKCAGVVIGFVSLILIIISLSWISDVNSFEIWRPICILLFTSRISKCCITIQNHYFMLIIAFLWCRIRYLLFFIGIFTWKSVFLLILNSTLHVYPHAFEW